jgi:hypothetical protein
MNDLTTEEMFKELSLNGYYLIFIGNEWCFGNELLDNDEYLLHGCHHKDKDIVIREGYLRLKKNGMD